MWLLYFLCSDPSKHPQACAACLPVTAAILPSAASFALQPEPWRRPHKEIKRGLRLADTLWPITYLFCACVCMCVRSVGVSRVGRHLVLAGKSWVGSGGRILTRCVIVSKDSPLRCRYPYFDIRVEFCQRCFHIIPSAIPTYLCFVNLTNVKVLQNPLLV